MNVTEVNAGTQPKAHPAADSFPMMNDARYAELRDDILENGLRQPITLYDGQVLDGRNRMKACAELGVKPTFRDYEGDPWAYVWSLNGLRRDLVEEQRYLIWKYTHEQSEEWQAKQAKRREEANEKRSEAMTGLAYAPKGGTREGEKVVGQNDQPPSPKVPVSRMQKAEAVNVNPSTVKRGDTLANNRPDLADKVRKGELKPAAAHRTMKREGVQERVAALPEGKHRVIYADPPWQYNDARALDGYEGSAAEGHYPTMSKSELSALDVRKLAADDAVLFCWATFPLLPDALEVVNAWGFKYKTAIVWDKQRANLGHYHNASAELLLICTRGACTPDADMRPDQVQSIERTGRHSEKPEHFRSVIDFMYQHGPRIELFRRGEAPDGWKVWGNEAE